MQVNEDKELLIESMRKLTCHISNNVKRQRDIFNSLSLPDLLKIINNLQDSNENLRKISALLLCEMAYKSEQIQKKIVSMLKLFPSQGRICLGGFPNLITNFPTAVRNCLELIKMPLKSGQQERFCWLINLDKKIVEIQYLDFKMYTSQTFIDPRRTLFGFTIFPNKKTERMSPISDKKQPSLLIPLRLSFNLNQSACFNETQKLETMKSRMEEENDKEHFDRKQSEIKNRSKNNQLLTERTGRLYNPY